ncbi:MAG: epoxyqueuosine reductase [Bacillota bacterium]
MSEIDVLDVSSGILAKAKELGASLAGVARVDDLKKAPSYTVTPLMEPYSGVGANKERTSDLKYGEVTWSGDARSVVVVAFAHPGDQPELDYWYGSIDPIGNKKLIEVVNGLIGWLKDKYGILAFHLPYHIERGGIYLKDAAVCAGLGCIGRNNLLVTPEYGPRIRLRGLTVPIDLPPIVPAAFDPCAVCDQICRRSCPQDSFEEVVYTGFEFGRKELPGRDGSFNRISCNTQMKDDEESAVEQEVPDIGKTVRVVKYCRRCELSCPVGRG